ncbi:MAG: ATP-binding protein [Bacteroidota bacterium]
MRPTRLTLLNLYPLFALLLLLGSPKAHGQNYVDSVRLLIQQQIEVSTDSVDVALLTSTLDTLKNPALTANDSLFLELIVPTTYKIGAMETRYAFIKLMQRSIEKKYQSFPSDQAPAYYLPFWIQLVWMETEYYDRKRDRVNSLQKKIELLELSERFSDTANIIKSLASIGFSYFNLRDYENTQKRFFRAYELAEQFYGKDNIPVRPNYALLEYYQAIDSAEKVREFADLTITAARRDKKPVYEGLTYRALSYFYYKKQAYQPAYVEARQALEFFEANGFDQWIPTILYRLVFCCIYLENMEEAERYLNKLKIPAQANRNSWAWSLYHEAAYEFYQAKKNYKLALESYVAYKEYRDSLDSEDIKQQLYDQQYQYEYRQRSLTDSLQYAANLQVQEANLQRRTVTNWFLGGFLVLALVFGMILFNRFRLTQRQNQIIEEEKAKLDVAIGDLNQANADLNAANEKLQELDNFKSRFFTNISHEFRTPLTVIGGMTQQMMSQPEQWLTKGGTLIQRNVQGLLGLINQILDLRKLESGSLNLNLVQSDVVQFIRREAAAFESMADMKEIALRFESKEKSLVMDFDPEKLGQIHMNLLSNALKFTPKGGEVEVNLNQQDPQTLELQVKDTGIGIPPEKLPLIFDRFYQVDGSETREGEGTGIGLSLTKELAQLMEGEIHVESNPGEGTTFTLQLPIHQQAPVKEGPLTTSALPAPVPAAPAPAASPAPTSTSDKPSLLIIEDNPDIVEYLYACLDPHYEVSSARDGQAGIDAALQQVPDLIITDVMMPYKNGYEVCEALKLDERTSHIPIVMLTAKADQASRLEGYKRGADAYLAKPFLEEELFIRLEKLLEIRRTLQQRYAGGAVPDQVAVDEPALQLEDAFLIKARQAILDHLDDSNYRGDSLGKDMGMSRTNFHRKIKALTGLSPSHFIRAVRLDQAMALMRNEELQISEIAYMTGFTNPNYFNRVFKEVKGTSPTKWREEIA